MKEQLYVGRQIAILRRKRKLSQDALASAVGVTRNYICQIEIGRKFPSFTLVGKLSSALGVSVSTLVEDDPIASDVRRLVDENGLEAVLATVRRLLDPGRPARRSVRSKARQPRDR
jgi:transcriptional regulator with XRE-family HTH domain